MSLVLVTTCHAVQGKVTLCTSLCTTLLTRVH